MITHASQGELPQYLWAEPIIAPTTRPQLKEASLPMLEFVMVDPRLQPKRDDLALTGLLDGVEGPASDGPGTDSGIGTGNRGGAGSGKEAGVGPGEGGNTRGGPRGRGGTHDPEYAVTTVDTAPVLLQVLRPSYTEEARKNKVQGIVRARILVGADGKVERVLLQSHLPYGLDEEAVQVAYKLRFRAATRNGQRVPFWMPLEIEFNLR
jgi:TonB family protein